MVKKSHKIIAPETPPTEPDEPTKIEIERSSKNTGISAAKTLNDVRDKNEHFLKEELQLMKQTADRERQRADGLQDTLGNLREEHARLDERNRQLKSQRSTSTLAAVIGGLLLALASFIDDKTQQMAILCTGATVSLIGIALDIRGCLSEWWSGSKAYTTTPKTTQG
jgi:molecular chaperone GrpE (heat shock protein)